MLCTRRRQNGVGDKTTTNATTPTAPEGAGAENRRGFEFKFHDEITYFPPLWPCPLSLFIVEPRGVLFVGASGIFFGRCMTDTTCTILIGDVRAQLKELRTRGVKVQCVVTSPPYWGLRDYGTEPQVWGGRDDCEHEWAGAGKIHKGGLYGASDAMPGRDRTAANAVRDIHCGAFCAHCGAWRGELGLEPHPSLFVEHIVEVFRLVRDVLADNGTCWVNMGDCYATGASGAKGRGDRRPEVNGRGEEQVTAKGYRGGRGDAMGKHGYREDLVQPNRLPFAGLKPKDLVGQPWRVAFALQDDGWWIRSDIIWHKPNPMPESIRDRPTKSHEYVFLLTKSSRYYYDNVAIKEPVTGNSKPRGKGTNPKSITVPAGWAVGSGSHTAVDHNRGPRTPKQNASFAAAVKGPVKMRNKRTVWSIPTEPYPEAHYATFPTRLVVPCILAGTKPGQVVLDCFGGSGTVGQVAHALGRSSILIDLDPANAPRMRARQTKGMIARKTRKLRKCDTIEMILEGAA